MTAKNAVTLQTGATLFVPTGTIVLDDDQWLKVIQRPPFAPRKPKSGPFTKQLLLWSTEFVFYIFLGDCKLRPFLLAIFL